MKISTNRVRQIIQEELQRLREGLDHEGIRDVVTTASKLLGALADFEAGASGQMTNAVSGHMEKLRGLAEDMIGNPASYLDPSEEQQLAKQEASAVESDVKTAAKPAEKPVNEVPPAVSKKVGA